ncbi:MAG: hypothetical protein IPL12_22730 [Bacteroidetes bacterium]|nr:hypothetical protein [Bacteroidota bacterium]
MKNSINQTLLALFVLVISAVSLSAQNNQNNKINFDRPYDKAGLNMFETPKIETVPFAGFN